MTEEELGDLRERTALIEDMASRPGWEMLRDRALVALYQRQQRLISGRIGSYEDYLKEVAWMDGVSFVLGLPEQARGELDLELMNRHEAESAVR